MSTPGTPEERPFKDVVSQAVEVVTDHFCKSGAAAAIWMADQLSRSPQGELNHEVHLKVSMDAAKQLCWQEEPLKDNPLVMMRSFPPNYLTGNDIVELGQELCCHPDLIERGRAALRFAGTYFEEAYVAMQQSSEGYAARARMMQLDYVRVAAAQHDASDTEGARTTALTMAPHLLALMKERRHTTNAPVMDETIRRTIYYIGSLENPFAQLLFKEIQSEHQRDVLVQDMTERFVNNLRALGRVTEGLSILRTADQGGQAA